MYRAGETVEAKDVRTNLVYQYERAKRQNGCRRHASSRLRPNLVALKPGTIKNANRLLDRYALRIWVCEKARTCLGMSALLRRSALYAV